VPKPNKKLSRLFFATSGLLAVAAAFFLFSSLVWAASSTTSINLQVTYCDNDGTCDSALGETTSNCSADCSTGCTVNCGGGETCNYNGVCDVSAGETVSNCSDCVVIPPATTTPLSIFGIGTQNITTSSAGIFWQTSSSTNCKIYWGTTIGYGQDASVGTTPSLSHSTVLSSLLAQTTYHFKIGCPNPGETTSTIDYTFETLAVATTTPTTTPPLVISGVGTQNITSSSAEVFWQTNRNAVCQIVWGLTTDYLVGSLAELIFKTSHNSFLNSLLANTTYHYKVSCQDEENVSTSTTDRNFKTSVGTDVTPPGNISGLYTVADKYQISLFWRNPTDIDFNGVMIRRSNSSYPSLNDGLEVYRGLGSPAGNGEVSFLNDNLSLDTGYFYSLFAYDNNDNFASGLSIFVRTLNQNATTTATTTIFTTTTPPSITTLAFSDFIFTQAGNNLPVVQNQVQAVIGQSISIALPQEKMPAGATQLVMTVSFNGQLETYNFIYNQASQSYVASLNLPTDLNKYQIVISAIDDSGQKVQEVSGWLETVLGIEEEIATTTAETIVDNVVKNVEAISKPVIFAAKIVAEAAKPLQEAAKSPAGTAVASVAVGASAVNLAFAIPWWNWYFLQFLFTQPWILITSKKRKGWGTVYNSITKRPIDLALVRLYDAKTKTLLKSRVTDRDGRYIFFVDEGAYYLQVQKPQFDFPSELLAGASEDNNFVDLYYGKEIAVSASERGVLVANIPLDPQDVKLTDREILKKHFKLANLSRLSYAGPIFAVVFFVLNPQIFSGLLAAMHLCLLLLFRRMSERKKSKSWGYVYDKENKKPLSQAVTRIFSPEYNRMLEFFVTDTKGRYGFLAGGNEYYVTADKNGYQTVKTGIIDLKGKKPEEMMISQDLALSKNSLGDAAAVEVESESVIEEKLSTAENSTTVSTGEEIVSAESKEETNLAEKPKPNIRKEDIFG